MSSPTDYRGNTMKELLLAAIIATGLFTMSMPQPAEACFIQGGVRGGCRPD